MGALFSRLDANGDGKLTRTEWSRLSQLFTQLDADKSGTLDAAEFDASPAAPATGGRTMNLNGVTPSSATSASSTRPAGNTDLASVWRGWIVDGRGENPNAGHMEIELTIVGNRITARELGTQRAPGGLGAGTFVMAGNGVSGNLDATATEGPNQGKNYPGVFAIEGDILRWCVSNRGSERPETMATDRGNFLMVLRRVRG
jgi:uncharacterized protein (TIGR03067 family)